MKTPEQIHAANRHASYMRGWIDGAKTTAMRLEFTSRPDRDPLRVAYDRGYGDGRRALGSASEYATAAYGHRPEILRLQGIDGAIADDAETVQREDVRCPKCDLLVLEDVPVVRKGAAIAMQCECGARWQRVGPA